MMLLMTQVARGETLEVVDAQCCNCLSFVILQGCLPQFGSTMGKTLYAFCQNKEAGKKPHKPRFRVACNLDVLLGSLNDDLIQQAKLLACGAIQVRGLLLLSVTRIFRM
mgnify:FL=1|jgi:hypothetical protein